jgi:hypothetical protein
MSTACSPLEIAYISNTITKDGMKRKPEPMLVKKKLITIK